MPSAQSRIPEIGGSFFAERGIYDQHPSNKITIRTRRPDRVTEVRQCRFRLPWHKSAANPQIII